MNILIPPGRSWLRVELLSPANFGSSGGRATLDRPVALNPWTELPFLPFSALTGVLAGRFGDVYSDLEKTQLNANRTRFFGSPDHEPATGELTAGKARDVVIGDGELLCFPVPLRTRQVGRIVPLTTAAWLARLGFLDIAHLPVATDTTAYTLLGGMPPDVEADGDSSVVPALLAALGPLVGGPLRTLVVAAPDAARILWSCATEVRTLTALQAGRKKVRAGSLRRVELLPSGTVFLALVTNHSRTSIDLGSGRLQLGGWEAAGCGFAEARVLVSAPPPAELPEPATQSRPEADLPPRADQLMIEAFIAVGRVPDALRPRLRSILRETGSRLRNQGIPSTLSFSLAKAKFKATKSNQEREAHRWLLGTFFPMNDIPGATVEAIAGQRSTSHLEDLCHWLSRYSELRAEPAEGIPTEQGQ